MKGLRISLPALTTVIAKEASPDPEWFAEVADCDHAPQLR
jgi:hypothetical protein